MLYFFFEHHQIETAQRRDVLGCTSLTTGRFSKAKQILQGKTNSRGKSLQ